MKSGKNRSSAAKEPSDLESGLAYSVGNRNVYETPKKAAKTRHSNESISRTPPLTPGSLSSTIPTTIAPSGSHETEATTVVVEHQVKQSGNGSRSMMLSLKKPLLAIMALVVFSTSGAAAFFLRGWLTIPGLDSQIDALKAQVGELETQVDRLETEVDRLEGEVDRFESLNNELNATAMEYAALNQQLNETAAEYEALNQELSGEVEALRETNARLTEEVETFEHNNEVLMNTTTILEEEVRRLEETNLDLQDANDELWNLTGILFNETLALEAINDELNQTVGELRGEVSELSERVDDLDSINSDLSTVVSFLNETSSTLQVTFESLTEFLAEQISSYRTLVLESVELTYQQRLTSWSCDLRTNFLTEPFAQNFTRPLGDRYEDVLDYVDQRVLSELCFDLDDFRSVLEEKYGDLPNISVHQLLSGVQVYSTDGLDYYFPENNEAGLTSEIWASASYECQLLPPSVLYVSPGL